MNRSLEGKIKINTFADIVGGEDDSVNEIELTKLYTFKNHPFKVKDDERMQEMVESIKKSGILVPGVVRKREEGGYEIISGHRRKRACELAGLKTMPMLIKKYTDDEAVIAMIDSNLQREEILPSEKAFAYKMKLEALSHQGKTTSCQVGTKLRSDDMAGKELGESARQIHRYIRLTELVSPLLDMVDEKKIKFIPAVELSYLTDSQQRILLEIINDESVVPSLSQAQQLKDLSQKMSYTRESVLAIMVVAPTKERRITLRQEVIYKYFDPDTSDEEIEKTICSLLEKWKRKGAK
ncbi:MAG: ParB/RepB/Spo0J family partition protein [Lachnospiraceae bacterium]|nr:ParB/RepB/Spo0J family partition protein [Lachnospiraceae bacterium]